MVCRIEWCHSYLEQVWQNRFLLCITWESVLRFNLLSEFFNVYFYLFNHNLCFILIISSRHIFLCSDLVSVCSDLYGCLDKTRGNFEQIVEESYKIYRVTCPSVSALIESWESFFLGWVLWRTVLCSFDYDHWNIFKVSCRLARRNSIKAGFMHI